jgi:hypothetical protein
MGCGASSKLLRPNDYFYKEHPAGITIGIVFIKDT